MIKIIKFSPTFTYCNTSSSISLITVYIGFCASISHVSPGLNKFFIKRFMYNAIWFSIISLFSFVPWYITFLERSSSYFSHIYNYILFYADGLGLIDGLREGDNDGLLEEEGLPEGLMDGDREEDGLADGDIDADGTTLEVTSSQPV